MSENTKNSNVSIEREKASRYTKILTLVAIFIAVEVVTEYMLSFTLDNQYRLSVTSVIRAIAGFTLGSIGGIISVICDLLGGFLFYGGSMIPTLTIVRGLQGLTHGLILHKKINYVRIVIAAVASTFFLNILGMVARYTYIGTPLSWGLAVPSLIAYTIMTAGEIIIVFAFNRTLVPQIKRLMYNAGVWKAEEQKAVPEESNDD